MNRILMTSLNPNEKFTVQPRAISPILAAKMSAFATGQKIKDLLEMLTPIDDLNKTNEAIAEQFRHFFEVLHTLAVDVRQLRERAGIDIYRPTMKIRLYPFSANGYSKHSSDQESSSPLTDGEADTLPDTSPSPRKCHEE
jgi:hypothetical protein